MQEKIYHFYVLSTLSDPDNIRYVGVTTRLLKERFSQHKHSALVKNSPLPVHKWMRKQVQLGDKILMREIDSCLREEWEETEIFYIQKYQLEGFNLLNVSKGGSGVITADMRSKDSMTRSAEGHQKPIIALNLDGSFYKEFASIKCAAKEMQVVRTSIGNVLSGRSKSAGGYMWVYKQDYNPTKKYEYHPELLDRRRHIYLFDYEGNLVKTFDRRGEVDEIDGWSTNGISSAINKKISYHGYFPSFSETINVDEYRRIDKYKILDKDGNTIYWLNSLLDALKLMGATTHMYYNNVNNNEFKFNDKTLVKLLN